MCYYWQIKIDISETSREFRQATFVLYNCARLAKLFANFEENVQKGENKMFYLLEMINVSLRVK